MRGLNRSVAVVLLAATGLFLCFPAMARAHGVTWRLLDAAGPVAFQVAFSGNQPAAYAKVLVYAPGLESPEFQNGRTDAKGRFAFVPDRQGVWSVQVDAGMGHQIAFEVAVNQDGVQQAEEPQGMIAPQWVPAALGVILLLNLGLFAGWLRRRLAAKT